MMDDMYNYLADIMKGMKLTVACMNHSRGESFNRGKYTLILDTLKKLCQVFVSYKKQYHIFAHCFLNLEWSLMARDYKYVCSRVNHL